MICVPAVPVRLTRTAVLIWLRSDAKRAIRTLLALEGAWWAIDLALPWPTFPGSHVYDLLAQLGPEWLWALLFGLDASLLICGFGRRRLLRIVSAGWDGMMHGIVVGSAVLHAPASTGTGTQTVWLLASYLLVEWEAMDG